MTGCHQPNIDRIANEGAIFTDYYGQQSCTAGRAAIHHWPEPDANGSPESRVAGRQGRPVWRRIRRSPTCSSHKAMQLDNSARTILATVTSFFRRFMASTSSSGNLYRFNAEDEQEDPDYPKNPAFLQRFGPRGVLKCIATSTETPGGDPRFGPWGKQKCEDTGPLTMKRMEDTVDDELLKASMDFIDRAHRDKKPFFVWFNPTRMHIWTRLQTKVAKQDRD